MSFTGRAVLVAGGTGNIGSGLVWVLLQQGAKVFVPSRNPDKFRQLQDKPPENARSNLHLVQADVTTEDGAKKIFDTVTKQTGGVQHVVSTIGGWWQKGNLVDQSLADFHSQMRELVIGHFLLFKNFAPYLEKHEGTTYTFVTGGSAVRYLEPGTSLLSVGAACLRGMSMVARAEHKDGNLAVSEFWLRNCWCHVDKLDREFAPTDEFNLGTDLVGRAICSVIQARERDVVEVRNRKEAEARASAIKAAL